MIENPSFLLKSSISLNMWFINGYMQRWNVCIIPEKQSKYNLKQTGCLEKKWTATAQPQQHCLPWGEDVCLLVSLPRTPHFLRAPQEWIQSNQRRVTLQVSALPEGQFNRLHTPGPVYPDWLQAVQPLDSSHSVLGVELWPPASSASSCLRSYLRTLGLIPLLGFSWPVHKLRWYPS